MESQQALRILNSWHLIEFFQTYSVEEDENSVQITASELSEAKDTLLPWLNDALLKRAENNDGNVRYVLHLGLFPKEEAERLSQQLFDEECSSLSRFEQEQRLDTEGMTCFAKLNVDKEGTPDFKSMSVSTLPWALGHLTQGTAAQLTVNAFRQRHALLTEQLNRLTLLLPTRSSSGKPYLTASALTELLKILYQWGQYSPASPFALQLDWYPLKAASTKEKNGEPRLTEEQKKPINLPAVSDTGNEQESSDQTLPILNSFFLEDIERAMLAVAQGEGGKPLHQYLSICQNRNSDLYSPQGLEIITRRLAPQYTPHGRWPSEPRFSQSLMQQFAINTALQELKEGGLLSVNGPPGTGKTTLLRDLIAHNVVERAKVLASLEQASAALDEYGFLIKSLTGFEMIVTSYNNAAVENISRELPQCKSLASEFRMASYLRPVANQLSAREDGDGKLQPLSEEDRCWGLIAATMGNKTNRTKFSSRFFFTTHFKKESVEEAHRPDAFNYLNYWRWYKTASPLTFSQAKEQFNAALAEVEQSQQKLQELEKLSTWLAKHRDSNLINSLEASYCEAVSQRDAVEIRQKQLQLQLDLHEEKVGILHSEYQVLEKRKPGWLKRLLSRTHYLKFLKQLEDKNQELINERKSRLSVREQLTATESHLLQLRLDEKATWQAWHETKTALQEATLRYENLIQTFTGMSFPGPEHTIRNPDTQRHAFWQNEFTNRQRSTLFVAAMTLHQAWLAEITRTSNPFRLNLINMSDFLSAPDSESNATSMWQLLFMMVPVVSTTFASLGRMFSGVSEAQLGWIMIDEAGQALPQAAVGALWRAKRVLVVGDPLQIEPVFATPPQLTAYLTEAVLKDDAEEWTPAKWSVQQLADRANPWGCMLTVMNTNVWVGIPLWVHRRCIEPMFSLANQIAYDGRMIHGMNDEAIVSQPLKNGLNNCWYESEGQRVRKQYKSELARDTEALLLKLSDAGYRLADIYVITPFKAVRAGLLTALKQPDVTGRLSRAADLSPTKIKVWCGKNVGTVHTFQGKENEIVIFVLGCDKNHQGGAVWAASKPNLLNVALTRAKRHIFVIGDRTVWANKPGFDLLAQTLPARKL